jgi:hypothetical protein
MAYLLLGVAFMSGTITLAFISLSILSYLGRSDPEWYVGLCLSLPFLIITVAMLYCTHEEYMKIEEIKSHPCMEWNNPYVTGGLSSDRMCTKRKL